MSNCAWVLVCHEELVVERADQPVVHLLEHCIDYAGISDIAITSSVIHRSLCSLTTAPFEQI